MLSENGSFCENLFCDWVKTGNYQGVSFDSKVIHILLKVVYKILFLILKVWGYILGFGKKMCARILCIEKV